MVGLAVDGSGVFRLDPTGIFNRVAARVEVLGRLDKRLLGLLEAFGLAASGLVDGPLGLPFHLFTIMFFNHAGRVASGCRGGYLDRWRPGVADSLDGMESDRLAGAKAMAGLLTVLVVLAWPGQVERPGAPGATPGPSSLGGAFAIAGEPAQGVSARVRRPGFLKGFDRMAIPFGPRRKRQMAAYSKRHYGKAEWRLVPRQIVLHYATAPTLGSVFNTFSDPRPDQAFGELPQVCAHFVIAPARAVQMVSLKARCRHTLGLNHVAIGIEHLGYSDGEVMGSRGMRLRSLSLVRRLRCLYGIPVRDVIGHSESLRSRYYRERVASLQGMTSADFSRKTMRTYRKKLARRACPRS